MDRRTFVLLTGSVSGGLIRPPRRRIARLAGVGRLKFDLDEQRRWSLWYYGDGPPVPLIQAAVVAARVGDQWITLADLEDSTVGSRRPPGGEAVVVRGRAAGVCLEAEFLSASQACGAGDARESAPAVRGGRGTRRCSSRGKGCRPGAHGSAPARSVAKAIRPACGFAISRPVPVSTR